MELRLAVLADYFEVEASGKFYIAGGFNQVVATEYPAEIGDRSLIIAVDGEYGEADPGVRVDIRLKDVDPPVASAGFQLEKPSVGKPGTPTMNYIRLRLNEIVLPVVGTYYFDIYLGDDLKQSLRFLAITPDMVESIV